MTTTSPPGRPPARQVRIRPLTGASRSGFLTLLSLATPGEPVPESVSRTVHLQPGRPPFTHGPGMCLTAHTGESEHPVGALLASVPEWAYTHPLCGRYPHLSRALQQTTLKINGIAVHPAHRGQGIARALLDSAERRARRAGCALAVLEHDKKLALSDFYRRIGYTVGEDLLIVVMPGRELLAQQYPRWYKTAVKPLLPRVRIRTVPGAPAPVVSGLLSGCELPPAARFHNGAITA